MNPWTYHPSHRREREERERLAAQRVPLFYRLFVPSFFLLLGYLLGMIH